MERDPGTARSLIRGANLERQGLRRADAPAVFSRGSPIAPHADGPRATIKAAVRTTGTRSAPSGLLRRALPRENGRSERRGRRVARAWSRPLAHQRRRWDTDGPAPRPCSTKRASDADAGRSRANFAAETGNSRLETRGGGRNEKVPFGLVPPSWSKKRIEGAEHLFDNTSTRPGRTGDGVRSWRGRTRAPGPRSRSMRGSRHRQRVSRNTRRVERLSRALSGSLCAAYLDP